MGVSKKNSFKFCSYGICNNANSCLPECQKPAFLTFRKVQIFPGSISPDPLMYMSYTPKSNSTPIKCKKAYQIECFFGEKNNKLQLANVSCTIDEALKVSPAVFLLKNRLLMESHLIKTMAVHCLWPFKTSI